MTIKQLLQLTCLFTGFSCSEHQTEKNTAPQVYSFPPDTNNVGGFFILNGPRQGFQYADKRGREYSYRYITTRVTNDSTIPLRTRITFPKDEKDLRNANRLMSDVFLLPRHLTPERQRFDSSMSPELIAFLDNAAELSGSLDTILKPDETIVMTFGILTPAGLGEIMSFRLVAKDRPIQKTGDDTISKVEYPGKPHAYLALELVNTAIVPCGELSFHGQK